MNMQTPMWRGIAAVLPLDAVETLVKAAAEAKQIADPGVRANRIDYAIYQVRTKHPEFFKE